MEKDLKSQLINRIITRYENASTRLKLAKENNIPEYEIWGKAYQKLMEYSKIVIPTLNTQTVEELQDIERVYITAEVVHNPNQKTQERRKEEAHLLDSVLDFHLQILKSFNEKKQPVLNPLPSKKKTDEEKIAELRTSIAKSDLLSDFRELRFSLDSFDNQIIFKIRDFPSERSKYVKILERKRELEKKCSSMIEELTNGPFTIQDLQSWIDRLKALNAEIKELYHSLNEGHIININDIRSKYHNAI